MTIEIRPAKLNDIDAIATIIDLVFETQINRQHAEYLLTLSHNMIYIATQDDTVVGFVENFVTLSQDNHIRLELDLLAVHPDARGGGIGKQLIATSIETAKQLDVHSMRVLVASQNTVMQKACQRMNITQSPTESALYVSSPKHTVSSIKQTSNDHLIRVNTLTYTGIWLEGDIDKVTVTNANLIGATHQLDTMGVVINKSDTQRINLLTEMGFTHINDYYRWTLNLKSD